jgi:putative ABC transport system permease protein
MSWTGLVVANLGRAKLRTALTGAAVALAVLLVCLLLTMPAGLDALVNNFASNTRLSVHHKAGIVYPLPYSFVRRVRQIDGVAGAMSWTWFGGAYEEGGQVSFPNFAVDPDQVAVVYPDYDIAPEHLADFQRYRDGALIGGQLVKKYGWKVGDRVTLKSTAWPVDLDFRIVGVIPDARAPFLWFQRAYLDQALQAQTGKGLGTAGSIWVHVKDPEDTTRIMRTIDDLSRNSEAETASETERSFFMNFFSSMKSLASFILVITALLSVCIVFIAANTASMAVRERSGEIAVMRAIGFGRRAIFATLVAESLVLSCVAGGLGIGGALGATAALRTVAGWNDALGPLGSFVVTPSVIVEGVVLSLFLGLAAGVVPALGAVRRTVSSALHEVF